MLSIKFQIEILKDYRMGKEYTQGKKYRYSIEYNPIALDHVWIVRQDTPNGSWEWLQPLHERIYWNNLKKEAYLV